MRRQVEDDGASAVEYALIVTAIAAVIVFAVFALGGVVTSMFAESCAKIDSKVSAPATC